MRIKKNILITLLSFSCFLLTGCSEKLYTMTSEEEDMIVSYSSAVVSKYNKKQGQGIIKLVDPKPKKDKKKTNQEDTDNTDRTDTDQTDTTEGQDPLQNVDENGGEAGGEAGGQSSEPENTAHETISLQTALGVDGISFKASPIQVVSSYNFQKMVSLVPSTGNSYVVLEVKGKNDTKANVDIDFLHKAYKYRFIINGTQAAENETTILLNDLSTYQGTIKPGQEVDLVLLFQFDKKMAASITDQRLEMTKDGNVYNVEF